MVNRRLLLSLLLVRIDVLGIDDVICLTARPGTGAIAGWTALTAALRSGLVHCFGKLVRRLRQDVGSTDYRAQFMGHRGRHMKGYAFYRVAVADVPVPLYRSLPASPAQIADAVR